MWILPPKSLLGNCPVSGGNYSLPVSGGNYSLPVYCITMDSDTISAAEGAYEGMEFLTFLTPTQEFQKAYEAKYSIPIDIGADSAYDAVVMIAQAMRETGTTDDTTELAEYLNNIKEYDGVSGHLISDGKGGFIKDYKVMKIINGEAVEINLASQ